MRVKFNTRSSAIAWCASLLALAGCSSSSGGEASQVENVVLPAEAAGNVPICFTARTTSTPRDVAIGLWYSTDDGRTWNRGTLVEDGVDRAFVVISVSMTPTQFKVFWNSIADLGFRATSGIRIRIGAFDVPPEPEPEPDPDEQETNLNNLGEVADLSLIHISEPTRPY